MLLVYLGFLKLDDVPLCEEMQMPDEKLVTGCWIEGKEVSTSVKMAVNNPADGSVVASVSVASDSECEASIYAAKKAFPEWKSFPFKKRAEIIEKWAKIIRGHSDFISTIVTNEVGKPIAAARSEVESAASFLEYCASEAAGMKRDVYSCFDVSEPFCVVREPVGVCGIITPYNYPLSTFVTKVGPALSVGCSVVVKPDEHTPLSTLFMASLTKNAGFPDGVVNVLCGRGDDVGRLLVEHQDVRLISFTGSTSVGKDIVARTSAHLKRLILELGGNCPAIISDDANWEIHIDSIVRQTFKNSGQYCYRITRLIVHRAIFDEFVRRFIEKTSLLNVGHPMEETTDLGPLNNRKIYERFRRQIIDICNSGAKILFGDIPREVSSEAGYYCKPIIITDLSPESDWCQYEYFGPVAFVQSYSNDDEAIEMANSTPFGLAAYIFTSDVERAYRWAESIEAGSLWVNCIHQARFDAPFGGYKESGLGREKSRFGFEAFTELKTIYGQSEKGY